MTTHENISTDWVGLKRIVRVERKGTRAGKPYQESDKGMVSLNSSYHGDEADRAEALIKGNKFSSYPS